METGKEERLPEFRQEILYLRSYEAILVVISFATGLLAGLLLAGLR
jgi:hypothetical protein